MTDSSEQIAPSATLSIPVLVCVLFGTIIGAGWITAAGSWVQTAGPGGALIAFAVGASLMTVVGLCFAESASVFPEAAGSVGFAYRSLGLRESILCGWCLIISYISTIAFFVAAVVMLGGIVVPADVFGTSATLQSLDVDRRDIVLAALASLIVGAITVRGMDFAINFQVILVLLIIVLGLLMFGLAASGGEWSRLQPLFTTTDDRGLLRGIAAVGLTTPFWFSGVDIVVQLINGKVSRENLRHLGKVIWSGSLAAFLFYVSVIMAVSMAMTRTELAESALPTVAAFETGLGLGWGKWVVVAGGILGVLTTWITCTVATVRIIRTFTRLRLLPAWMAARQNDQQMSTVSVFLILIIGFVLGVRGEDAIGSLLLAAGISLLVAFCIVCFGVIKARNDFAHVERPYRAGRTVFIPTFGLLLSSLLLLMSLAELFQGAPGVPPAIILLGVLLLLFLLWWILVGRKSLAKQDKQSVERALLEA